MLRKIKKKRWRFWLKNAAASNTMTVGTSGAAMRILLKMMEDVKVGMTSDSAVELEVEESLTIFSGFGNILLQSSDAILIAPLSLGRPFRERRSI